MNPEMALKLLGALKKAKGKAAGVALPAFRDAKRFTRAHVTGPARHAAAATGRLSKTAGDAMGRAGANLELPRWMKVMGAAAGGVGAYDLATWGLNSLTGDGEVSEKELRLMLMRQAAKAAQHQESLKPMQRAIEDNKRSLATTDPTLMNSILGGEPLMDGEEILGGEPRTDLLDLIALQMAQGGFKGEEDLF